MNQQLPILKTLSFFQIYSHPLTLLELTERLVTPNIVALSDLKVSLDLLLQKGAVIEDRGFFFLSGSAEAVEQRTARILWENNKMSIARRAARILRLVPFVRLVAVCNTLSFGVTKQESDIDFFIVAQARRLWLVRALSVLLLFLCGLYRRGNNIQNQICLSFFIDEKNLDLQKLSLPENDNGPDIYLIYWITQLVPLINRGQTLEKFWRDNLWINKYLANWDWSGREEDYRSVEENKFFSWKRKSWEFILRFKLGDIVERLCKYLQLLKMKRNVYSRRWQEGTEVVVNDEILKFHEADRRELYRKMWKKNLEKINV